ncbi:MAG: DUF3987 domain-containing protein [Conexibacteraceae bacterium]|nr:DUF3987 domain-containing protein [Conexibacteraceae bacterium]
MTPLPAPELEPAAFAGPIGDWVLEASPLTEADPAALLLSALVAFGVAAGPDRVMMAANRPQGTRLFAMLVGDSAKSNRGLSWTVTRDLLAAIDPGLARRRVLQGLGNGRPLLDALASPKYGPAEERLLVFEPGVTHALRVAGRARSPLAWALRNAWDGAPIERPPGSRPLMVERYHVGVIAHATIDQLRPQLSLSDASASLVNRFVYAVIRRRKVIADEGNVPPEIVLRHGSRLARAAIAARGPAETMRRTPSADRRWRSIYEELAEDDPDGLLGIALARSARHVLRLSLVYALAEEQRQVGSSHVEAALAVWRYARASAVQIFTERRAEETTERLLTALRAAGGEGLTLTEQTALFGRNVPAARIAAARETLERSGLAVTAPRRRRGSGRVPLVTQIVSDLESSG